MKKGKGGQVAEQKGERKREGQKVELHLPPLGLVSFCILCCVPAG